MIAIPLYILLFVYLLCLVVLIMLFLFNFYHLVQTGTFSFASLSVTFFVLIGVLLVLYITWFALLNVDWQSPLIEFSAAFFNFE